MNMRDWKPGMRSVYIKVTIGETSEAKQIIPSKGDKHEIFEAEVKDETGSIMLIFWDKKFFPLRWEKFRRSGIVLRHLSKENGE